MSYIQVIRRVQVAAEKGSPFYLHREEEASVVTRGVTGQLIPQQGKWKPISALKVLSGWLTFLFAEAGSRYAAQVALNSQ